MIAVHHEKSLVPAFFKVSVGHLYDNRESGKINYCFGKSFEFWIRISIRTLLSSDLISSENVQNVVLFSILINRT